LNEVMPRAGARRFHHKNFSKALDYRHERRMNAGNVAFLDSFRVLKDVVAGSIPCL
jgi:hypothetical protein